MVFNVQRYSVHDGPGIRTVVFLKGCPMKCRWCSNPESQAAYPELAFQRRSCMGYGACGLCREIADSFDSEDKPLFTSWSGRQADAAAMACSELCPAKALNIYGSRMSVQEVLQEVEKDMPFYRRSGGGLTLSGGEVLAQPEFAEAILAEAVKRHIHTAVETCGCGDWQVLKRLAVFLDYIMYDVKCFDEGLHIKGTGSSNKQILQNLSDLAESFPELPILVRTPIIPGFNDNAGEIGRIADFLAGWQNVSYELLPYHAFGKSKYEALGRPYPMGDVALKEDIMAKLQMLIEKKNYVFND